MFLFFVAGSHVAVLVLFDTTALGVDVVVVAHATLLSVTPVILVL